MNLQDEALALTSAAVLGSDGLFSRTMPNFGFRQSQLQMAEAIEQAIETQQTLLAESGTGTGKTFAYLVPALLSGKKTLISTGTKHLQEQLFHRDIPAVIDSLSVNAKVSLLKGRANYLCQHRLDQTQLDVLRFDRQLQEQLAAIREWANKTAHGDIAEPSGVPEDSRLWSKVTSTVDNCLGQECAYFDDCFVNKARKEAISSEVVVINHHLYFADKSLKNEGFGSLLPEVDCVIFDEAHQVPDVASHFLGRSFSSWQVLELVADARAAEMAEKSLVEGLLQRAGDLEKYCTDTRLSLGLDERRESWEDLLEQVPPLAKKMKMLVEHLQRFAEMLEAAAAAGEALSRCHERALMLAEICSELISDGGETDANETGNGRDRNVRWVEIARRTFRIHETPLDIGATLGRYFGDQQQTRVFTSATLSVAGDFTHFRQLSGVPEEAQTRTWESPFDFFKQAMLYVPEGLPEPKEEGFVDAIYNAIVPLLVASQGHAFLLFTSFRVMRMFELRLREEYDEQFSVLMQGKASKSKLLHDFINRPQAVLLGTMSFWEGVDVAGSALRLVVIDKLPFESPFEPVLKARLKALQESGGNPFVSYQLPRAVMTLRQGAGRLIRQHQDRGVLMICDTRLRGTHYGKVFLNSLPRMRRTSDLNKATRFLTALSQSDERE